GSSRRTRLRGAPLRLRRSSLPAGVDLSHRCRPLVRCGRSTTVREVYNGVEGTAPLSSCDRAQGNAGTLLAQPLSALPRRGDGLGRRRVLVLGTGERPRAHLVGVRRDRGDGVVADRTV